MNIWSELSKITIKDLSLGLFNILFLVTPGFLMMFLFDKDLFLKLDVSKLIILSLAVIAPFIVINFFFFQKAEEKPDTKITSFSYLVLSTFTSIIILDSGLFISYIFNLHIKVFVIITIFIQILALVTLDKIHSSYRYVE